MTYWPTAHVLRCDNEITVSLDRLMMAVSDSDYNNRILCPYDMLQMVAMCVCVCVSELMLRSLFWYLG